jgi:hypothetical protein
MKNRSGGAEEDAIFTFSRMSKSQYDPKVTSR